VLQAGETFVLAEKAVLCTNGSNCKVKINWVPLSGGLRPITVFGEEAWKMNVKPTFTHCLTPRGKGKEKCLVFPVHAMKAYRGCRGTAPLIFNLGAR